MRQVKQVVSLQAIQIMFITMGSILLFQFAGLGIAQAKPSVQTTDSIQNKHSDLSAQEIKNLKLLALIKQELKNNPNQARAESDFRNGVIKKLKGHYTVELTLQGYHFDKTIYAFSGTCGTKYCVINFWVVANESFMDFYEKLGIKNQKFLSWKSGDPYPYTSFHWAISYPNPHLKKKKK